MTHFQTRATVGLVGVGAAMTAAAQSTPASSTIVDLTAIQPIVVEVLGIVITTLAGILTSFLCQRLGIARNQALVQQIADAAGRGAGLAYKNLVATRSTTLTVDVLNQSIAEGANYVVAAFPDYLKKLNLDPANAAGRKKIEELVAGQFGRLLAVDPTIGIAKS